MLPLFGDFPLPDHTKTGPFRKLPALLLTVLKSFVVIESLDDQITIPKAVHQNLKPLDAFKQIWKKINLELLVKIQVCL